MTARAEGCQTAGMAGDAVRGGDAGEKAGTAGGALSPAARHTPEEKVIHAFVRDGRLVSIPAREQKRDVILRWLLERCFPEPGATWPEPDVNMRLALVHRDVAALRRYLVDAGYLARDAGIYRRGPRASG